MQNVKHKLMGCNAVKGLFLFLISVSIKQRIALDYFTLCSSHFEFYWYLLYRYVHLHVL